MDQKLLLDNLDNNIYTTPSNTFSLTSSTTGGQYQYYSYHPITSTNWQPNQLMTSNIFDSILNPLSKLCFNVDFELDKDNLLNLNIKSIKNKKMLFNCNYYGNRIQPYEFIMKLIEEKRKFSVKIKIPNVLSIVYTNFQFTKIENNLNFDPVGNCDFSVIKVKFKYEKISYQNLNLSEKELRADKIKKIISLEKDEDRGIH